MKVIRAKTAGFCMGVDLALNKLDKLIEKEGGGQGLHTLGPIIHNPQVLCRYAGMGVAVAESPAEVPEGGVCLIRAHGVPRERLAQLKARRVRTIDATCPRVKKAQVLIRRESEKGRTLLLYGENDHPEVQGLLSYALPGAVVFDSREELENRPPSPGTPYVLAAQTTQDRQVFLDLAREMEARPELDVVVLNTICDATRLRQDEATKLAGQVDRMVVVGGYSSGNTRRLAQVCREAGTPCVHVETVDELPLEELAKAKTLGLTAGASTPKDIIDAVERALEAL
ncbi:MAG: 4-hydroxy-3-methylbut-2-enyl diphosphate reductase [Desulfovibrionaceae bacterium]